MYLLQHVRSMTSADFMNKMAILKQERVQKANVCVLLTVVIFEHKLSKKCLPFFLQKLPNFWDIRQQYHTEVDQLAKQKLEKQRAEEKAGKLPTPLPVLTVCPPLQSMTSHICFLQLRATRHSPRHFLFLARVPNRQLQLLAANRT